MPDPDINQQILDEIRKLRRSNQWGMIVALLLLLAVSVFAFRTLRNLSSHRTSPWGEVSTAMRESDYPKALRLAQELATAHPDDYYAHEYLGNIYLAMGEPSHAEAEYVRAYQLLPSEDIKAKLDAIRKRLENDTPKAH